MLVRILLGIIYIVLPLVIVGALLVGCVALIGQGISYWADVTGTAYDKSTDFVLPSLGKGLVIYPEFVRPAATQKIEVELTPSGTITVSTVLSVTVRDDDSFLTVVPTVLTSTLTSGSALTSLKFDITTRNPEVPPKYAGIDVEVYDAAGQRMGHAPIQLTVNAWTGKIVSIAAVLGGLIGVLAATVGLIAGIRTLVR